MKQYFSHGYVFHSGSGRRYGLCSHFGIGHRPALSVVNRPPGSFGVVLAVMPLLMASVILIANGNLGTSVAVLGAFGLVRFRSAPGTAREIGFLFYAMAVGLAEGMGFLSLGAIITLVVGGAIFILERARFGKRDSTERMLRIAIPEDLNYTGIFDDLFKIYTKHTALERVKTTNMGTMYELVLCQDLLQVKMRSFS